MSDPPLFSLPASFLSQNLLSGDPPIRVKEVEPAGDRLHGQALVPAAEGRARESGGSKWEEVGESGGWG